MTKLTLSVLALAFFITGCDDGSGSDHTDESFVVAHNYSNIVDELKKGDFECVSKSNCPNNVGLIAFNFNGKSVAPEIGQCTGFLIDEGIVATNSHCIPDRLKSSGESCEGQLAIRFMGKDKTYGCQELISYSEVKLFDADYAFFRIKESGISPLSISKKGLENNQNIMTFKVDPIKTPGRISGELTSDTCVVKMGTLLNMKALSRWSITGLGLGCHTIKGNSGGPVLNSDNEVIGILQSVANEVYGRAVEKNFRQYNLQMPDPIEDNFAFTNLSCVKDPVSLEYNKSKCDEAKKLKPSSCGIINTDLAEFKANVEEVYKSWASGLPDIFVYKITSAVTNKRRKTVARFMANPVCVKTKKQDPGAYSSFVSESGLPGFKAQDLKVTFEAGLDINYDMVVTEGYQLDYNTDIKSEKSIVGTELKKSWGRWTGRYSHHERRKNMIRYKKAKLPSCTDEQFDKGNVSFSIAKDGQVLTEDQVIENSKKRDEAKSKTQVVCEQ